MEASRKKERVKGDDDKDGWVNGCSINSLCSDWGSGWRCCCSPLSSLMGGHSLFKIERLVIGRGEGAPAREAIGEIVLDDLGGEHSCHRGELFGTPGYPRVTDGVYSAIGDNGEIKQLP